jgi:hypothetical protein
MTDINRLHCAIASVASSGLGAITVGAAVAGRKTFSAAENGQSFDSVLIEQGSAWELRNGCVYTHSGTTLSRGVLEESSTGAPIAFTSAATLSVTISASRAAKFQGVVDIVTAPHKDYTVGTFYFGGWSTPGGGPNPSAPWAVIPDNRKPLYGDAPDETTQAYCDYNLELMRDNGIDFVAILIYFQDGGGGAPVPYLDHFLQRYVASKVFNKPKFCLVFECQTNASLYNSTTWTTVHQSFHPYFRDKNYLKFNGKPAVVVFDVPGFHTIMGSAAAAGTALANARTAANSEFGGIHFMGCSSASGEYWASQMTTAGWDGVTSYTVFFKTEVYGDAQATSKTGFDILDDAVYGPNEVISSVNRHSWMGNAGYANPPAFPNPTLQQDGWAGRSTPASIWAPVMTGWDAKPWNAGDTLNAIPTDAQFEAHLVRARSAVDAARPKTKGFVLVTAWNEFGEGQYIQPTKSSGMARLLAIKRVFG